MVQTLHGCANNRSEVDAEDTRTQQHVDRISLNEMPDETAPYFYPVRDGGNKSRSDLIDHKTCQNHEPHIFTPPGTAATPTNRTALDL